MPCRPPHLATNRYRESRCHSFRYKLTWDLAVSPALVALACAPSCPVGNSKEEFVAEKRPAKQNAPKEAGSTKPKMADRGPGVTDPKIQLYCKAGPDGESLGDCPFTHYVQVGTVRCVVSLWSAIAPRCR